MKKVLFFLFILFLNISLVFAVDISKAYDYTYEKANVDLVSKNVILYNLTDNYKLIDIKSDESVQIASLTKIMTILVALDKITDVNEKVTITSDVFNGINDYSKAGFKVGDKVTYLDLLYGAMLPSGADAVNALVLNISGNYDDFIKLMNEKAKSLGLKKTKFDNVIGRDSSNNYSSAYDIALMINYGLENEVFNKMFTSRKYTTSNNLVLNSTISLYGKNLDVSAIKGSKSGYTDGAGVCFASLGSVNDVDYLLVVLGASTNNKSNAVRDSVDIYNYVDKNYGYKVLLDKDKVIDKLDIVWGKEKKYILKVDKDVSRYVKNTIDLDKVEYKYKGVSKLKYGIKKGDKLGSVDIVYKDSVIGSTDVYLNKDIKYYHPVIYTIMFISFISMVSSYIKICKERKRRKKKRRKNKTR